MAQGRIIANVIQENRSYPALGHLFFFNYNVLYQTRNPESNGEFIIG